MDFDVVILGGGAAGLMCAAEAGNRGRSVVVLEGNANIGEKIRVSGGGRCNFTNINAASVNYISVNPHFSKSALARFSPNDFVALVEKHRIRYYEKKHGQLFCDGSAQFIIDLFKDKCASANALIRAACVVKRVAKSDRFVVETSAGEYHCDSLVVATGGLSIPKLGASPLGYRIAEQFGLKIVPPKPGLVPLTLAGRERDLCRDLSGVSIDTTVACGGVTFREELLFTHRGLSGPAILQASSYWNDGDSIIINLLPDIDLFRILQEERSGRKQVHTILEQWLPKRFVEYWCTVHPLPKPIPQCSDLELKEFANELRGWRLRPSGTEGYTKAEVTVGGVDTNELSSKTMEAKNVLGLYFIGEVVDVTGWLGGYNFQWAWSSGWVAGQCC